MPLTTSATQWFGSELSLPMTRMEGALASRHVGRQLIEALLHEFIAAALMRHSLHCQAIGRG